MGGDAAAAVSSIPELVEAILVHVDKRTVLVSAQRVSSTWHDIVQTSCALRRALWFDAAPEGDDHGSAATAPIITTPEQGSSESRDDNRSDFLTNELLKEAFTAWFRSQRGIFDMGDPSPDNLAFSGAIRYAGASWRRMLVSRPPVTRVAACDERSWPYGILAQRAGAALSFPQGLRMGELFDLSCQIVSRRQVRDADTHGFCVRWSRRVPYAFQYYIPDLDKASLERTGGEVQLVLWHRALWFRCGEHSNRGPRVYGPSGLTEEAAEQRQRRYRETIFSGGYQEVDLVADYYRETRFRKIQPRIERW